MTASRIGGSSGIAAIAAEIPASRFAPASWPRMNPSAGDDDDQADGDDEQDPDEAVQLGLQRRAATFARDRGRRRSGRPRSPGPSPRRRPRRDRRRRSSPRTPCACRSASGASIGSGSIVAGSGTDSPVRMLRSTQQPIDPERAAGRPGTMSPAAEQHDVARARVRRAGRPRRRRRGGPGRSGRSPRGAPRAPARRGTR